MKTEWQYSSKGEFAPTLDRLWQQQPQGDGSERKVSGIGKMPIKQNSVLYERVLENSKETWVYKPQVVWYEGPNGSPAISQKSHDLAAERLFLQ